MELINNTTVHIHSYFHLYYLCRLENNIHHYFHHRANNYQNTTIYNFAIEDRNMSLALEGEVWE